MARAEPCRAGRAAPAPGSKTFPGLPLAPRALCPVLGRCVTVPRLYFPSWVLISEPKGFAFIVTLSPQDHRESLPPTSKRRRSACPSAHAPRVEAQLRAWDSGVRNRGDAQRSTGAVLQGLMPPLGPPTSSLPQRAGARAHSEPLRMRTESGRAGWRVHEAGQAAEAGVVDWVGREGGGRAGARVAGARAA